MIQVESGGGMLRLTCQNMLPLLLCGGGLSYIRCDWQRGVTLAPQVDTFAEMIYVKKVRWDMISFLYFLFLAAVNPRTLGNMNLPWSG